MLPESKQQALLDAPPPRPPELLRERRLMQSEMVGWGVVGGGLLLVVLSIVVRDAPAGAPLLFGGVSSAIALPLFLYSRHQLRHWRHLATHGARVVGKVVDAQLW